MTTLNRFGCFLIISFVLFCLLAATPTLAQTRKAADSNGQETATKEILDEVRLLRRELAQSQQRLLKLFSITEHLRAQQELVFQLNRNLDETRRQLHDLNFDPTQAAEKLADMEKKVNVGVLDKTKYQQFSAEVERQTQRDQELRAQEISLTAQLKAERAKLGDLNQQLEALEREISR